MLKVFVLNRHKIGVTAAIIACFAAVVIYTQVESQAVMSSEKLGERTIQMVTGEFKTTTTDGKEIEAYRWDPGTVYVKKGEKVQLVIYGVNGVSHPFIIEGLNLKGEVKKGKETHVSFLADKEGIYRIICLTHPDIAHSGPMIGYIVVD